MPLGTRWGVAASMSRASPEIPVRARARRTSPMTAVALMAIRMEVGIPTIKGDHC